MLARLYVQNYALIRELDLELGHGLTVITGETGAGKSILLGALSLVLGARADSGILLDESVKCIVEATFKTGREVYDDFFTANELDISDDLILRREISPGGKSRAFINDTPVNLNILKELGEKLVDIHSQHQTLILNESKFQLSVLDSFASNSQLLSAYSSAFNEYRKLTSEYNLLKESSDKNNADLEYFRFQLAQLDEAKFKANEDKELESEQEILEHASEIKGALTLSSLALGNDEQSALSCLNEVKIQLGKIRDIYPPASGMYDRINSVIIEVNDLFSECSRLAESVEADPERLEVITGRLDLLNTLLHRHRVNDIGGLVAKQEEMRKLVATLATGDERMAQLKTALNELNLKLARLSSDLTERRMGVIAGTEEKINELLRKLGMPNARFRVELNSLPDFNPTGRDKADFLFSSNKQVNPENLSKVASGGELSRVMLSLKSVLSRNKNLPAIIFDEIDSGVSGEVADMVGTILSEMGETMQVINITHLPQVAAKGAAHFHVYKNDTEHSTNTHVRLLSDDERIFEVARLLSGSEVTDTAIMNARELLAGSLN
jgi:DNA repair protein RecN (Recombination protein N)